jgi:hypothetical protein
MKSDEEVGKSWRSLACRAFASQEKSGETWVSESAMIGLHAKGPFNTSKSITPVTLGRKMV